MRIIATLVAAATFFGGNLAFAEHWHNRPNVIRAANILAEEVEKFDTALHNVQAPAHIIQKVHHFEESVTEFAQEVVACTYQVATQEMNHIRQDYGLIRQELYAHPQLLQNPAISLEWQHVKTAYRNLDHQMFQWDTARWTTEKVQALEKDMAELEADHD